MRVSLPILAGPLRGARYLPAAGGKLARLLLGRYEPALTARFVRHVRPGQIVFDLGAAAGYYTLLAARLVGASGRVVAFEPEPRNFGFLREHVRMNRLACVELHNAAVGNGVGSASFSRGRGSGTGRLDPQGSLRVPIVRLDDLIEAGLPRPHHVKIDVEGAEAQVLAGAADLLRGPARPTLFLSTHGPAVHAACSRTLREQGYALEPLDHSDAERASELLCLPR